MPDQARAVPCARCLYSMARWKENNIPECHEQEYKHFLSCCGSFAN
jgi:hypothetical protein